METAPPFIIYDAAAGSGKTFTLVKEFLITVLRAKSEDYYKHLLGITFTNMAVAEMKQRIISNLVAFSHDEVLLEPSDMARIVASEAGLTLEKLQKQSQGILKHLLHHYANFSVETIDHFNHRLIRTFARDLHLSGNFEVSLDTSGIIQEAVDQLIAKAGTDEKTTKVLLDFALAKIDEDRSWDISRDISKASELLYQENEAPHVAKLKGKSLDDFLTFTSELKKRKKTISEEIKKIAEATLQLVDEAGLQLDDFSRSYLPKYFLKLAQGDFGVNFGLGWQNDLGEKVLYPTRVDAHTAEIIDELTPQFIAYFERTKTLVPQVWLLENMIKNSVPLSVINLVRTEIEKIKEEQNIVPISEFNSIINEHIKDQPAPFIYERLGERYRHFFIDEFQDTSLLQWQNLIPLIENTLSQGDRETEQGSLLLVGDVKQSIYRWRGGLPEQFMHLCQGQSPFYLKPEHRNLGTNYRSCQEIIDFNNDFFSYISQFFGSSEHKDIYIDGNQQAGNNKVGGYVHINFIESENKEDADGQYAEKVYKTILELKEQGYQEADICILTRTKKNGISIGSYLMEQEVDVISSETLLLKHSPIVQCLINTITLSLHPENEEVKIDLLNFLYDHFEVEDQRHSFFTKLLPLMGSDFSDGLKGYEIDFDIDALHTHSLYPSLEYCIRRFGFNIKADAYLFGLMDFAFEFEQQPFASKTAFLETWEKKKEKEGISMSSNTNAVRLMTIHKSKGLEFPVVIFPYADVNIYQERDAKAWFPLEVEISGFDESMIQFSDKVATYGEIGEALYQDRRNTLELDAFNLLYVTLTRAKEQLFIFSEKPKPSKNPHPSSYNKLLMTYLEHKGLWDTNKLWYAFGRSERGSKEVIENQKSVVSSYIATSPQSHQVHVVTSEASLWETEAKEAIDIGILLHDTMALIGGRNDVNMVFESIIQRGFLNREEAQDLRVHVEAIMDHPQLSHFYETSEGVENERDIITASGRVLRPDRLNFQEENSVSIIDYKTGNIDVKNEQQVEEYADALKDMGYQVSEKILVYTSKDGIVINKV